jgi:hypothetical protein
MEPLEATILNPNLDIQAKYSAFVATITSAIMEATPRKGFRTATKAHKNDTNPLNRQSQRRHSNPAPFFNEGGNRLITRAFHALNNIQQEAISSHTKELKPKLIET